MLDCSLTLQKEQEINKGILIRICFVLQFPLKRSLGTHLLVYALREGEQYVHDERLHSHLLSVQTARRGDGANYHVQRHQHVGHAGVPELEGPAAQQLRQHGAQQPQRADAHTQDHAALRRGAHVSVHAPGLQQHAAHLLQDAHTRVQTLAGKQLDPRQAPLEVSLLTC